MPAADVRREVARAFPRNIDDPLVRRDLIERGQQPLGFGQQFPVVVALDLHQHVVHAQSVVLHRPLQIGEIALFARNSLEDVEQLGGGIVQRVVERYFVALRALVVP